MILHRGLTLQDYFPGKDLCTIPVSKAPHGGPPNFVNPPSLQPTVIIISTVMLTAATVILAGRLFHNRRQLKSSDWTMIVGFIFNVATTAVQLALSPRFRHSWDTPLCHVQGDFFKMIYVSDIFTGISLFFPKAAIFLFYIEVFSSTRSIRVGSIAGIGMAFLAYFPASLTLSYWNAPHVGQTWEELAANEEAHKGIPGGITMGVASVLIDIFIFLLPLRTLSKLNMSRSRRMKVISLFATALLGVGASVACLVYRIKLLWLTDATWQAGVVGIPIIIENNVAIIVGSLPAFTGFFRRYIGESQAVKSIRSRLFTSGPDSKDGWHPGNDSETFGGNGNQRRNPLYYELSDSNILKSQVTMPNDTYVAGRQKIDTRILRTVALDQQEYILRSQDRLV